VTTSKQQDFKAKQSLVARNTTTINSTDFFVTTGTFGALGLPPINLNFTKSGVLDPRLTFTRPSVATYVGPDGFIKYASANQPRIDYDPVNVGYCRGLLIEEQKTNLFWYSSDITQWVSQPTVKVVANATMAPDGSQTACYVSNTINVGSQCYSPVSFVITTGSVYVQSIYVKPVSTYATSGPGAGTIVFQFNINGSYKTTTFDTIAQTVTQVSTGTAFIYPAGNGWVRCVATVQPQTVSDSLGIIYLGTWGAYNNNMTVALWGAQLEIPQYPNNGWYSGVPTSYIPTNGSAVTRSLDYCLLQGQSITNVLNQNNGTLFAEYMQGYQGYASLLTESQGIATITNPTNGGYIGYGFPIGGNYSNNQIYFQGRNQGNYSQALANPYSGSYLNYGQIYRVAGTYDPNTLWVSLDGSAPSSGGNSNVSSTMNYQLTGIIIGQTNVGGVPNFEVNGWIRKIQYWPQTLPPASLPQLTTTTVYSTSNFVNAVINHVANTTTFILNQGLVTGNNLEISDIDHLYATNLTRPTQAPTLNLNFLKGTLDPRVTMNRASGGTYVGPDGFIKYAGANQPRFDYSTTSTGTCLGLLVEEQRTNLYYWSTQLTTSTWGNNSLIGNYVSIQENAIQSPDGTFNAPLLTGAGGYLNTYITPLRPNVARNTWYTKSWYGKYISGSGQAQASQIIYGDGTSAVTSFNIVNGYVYNGPSYGSTTGTSSITYAGNGWWRCSVSILTSSTSTLAYGDIISIGGYGGAATTTTQSIWGVQLEIAGGPSNDYAYYPTSLIPTQGATATRICDDVYMYGQNFQSWFNNPAQGTLTAEWYQYFTGNSTMSNNPGVWSLTTSTGPGIGNYVYAYGYGTRLDVGNQTNNISIIGRGGNPANIITFNFLNTSSYLTANNIYKIAAQWSATNSVIVGGATYSAVGYNPVSLYVPQYDTLILGFSVIGGLPTQLNGALRKFTFYPETLSIPTMLTLVN